MRTHVKFLLLPVTVFLTGACVLIVEVVATRILSPYFGNTIFSISSVISVILAALSVGYYIGGKLADKYPSLKWFFSIILLSSLVLLGLHGLGQFFLPRVSQNLSITTGPLITSFMLFFLPSFLLGTLSPYAIKLQQTLTPNTGIGTISGTMFFWSTFGSILGSLSTGFFFIPNFGINQIVMGVSFVLFITGIIPLFILRSKYTLLLSLLVIFSMISVTVYGIHLFHKSYYTYQTDGVYERISIFNAKQFNRPVRVLNQDSTNSGAMFLDSNDPTDLAYKYTNYLSLYKETDTSIKNVLVIGGGPYTIPKALLHELPDVQIDVVDIEPSLYQLAQTYFDLKPDSRLSNIVEDGRRFLIDTDKRYDLIFADAYGSLYSVPTHLMTKEFIQLSFDHLTDDGLFIGNFIGDTYNNEPSIILSAMKTFESVFNRTYYFGAESPLEPMAQNVLFLGLKNGHEITFQNQLFQDHLMDASKFDLSSHQILTDDFAPVEYLSAQTLKRQTN